MKRAGGRPQCAPGLSPGEVDNRLGGARLLEVGARWRRRSSCVCHKQFERRPHRFGCLEAIIRSFGKGAMHDPCYYRSNFRTHILQWLTLVVPDMLVWQATGQELIQGDT